MSNQYPGGIITKNPATPTGPYESGAAPGIWTLTQQAAYAKQGIWPTAGLVQPDPQFNYVTMLLHGDGTNGAQNNTFLDSSTNNFTITRYGNATQGSFSPYGANWSTSFVRLGTGYGDGFTFPNSTALQMGTGDFTIEMWVFEAGTVSYQTFYEKGYVNAGGFLLQMFTDLKPYVYANGSLLMTSSTAIAIGVWTHLAVVRSGSTMTMYLNGVSVASASNSTNFNDASIGGIGARSFDNTYPFNGYLSNLRVVKGTAVYTGTFTPPTSPLTAISGTSLLVMQSNRFIDNSSNNVTLTAQNTPSVQRFNPFGASTAYSTSVIGGSGYFDGTGDYLSVANNAALNFSTGSFTVEGWIFLNAYPSAVSALASKYNSSAPFNGWELQINSSGVLRTWIGTTYLITSASALTLNVWNHLAMVRNGSTVTLYINGVSAGTGTSSTDLDNTGICYIATEDGSTTIYGYLSNIRIVKGTAVYTAAFTPPTAPLTAVSGTSMLLNYTNGAIFDNAMMNNLETVGNAQISTSVVKYGTGSLAFDGTGDYLVSAPSPANILGSGDFTIELWLYPSNTSSAYRSLVASENYPNTTGGWDLYQNGTSLEFWITGPTQIINATSAITATNWQHLALCRASGTLRLFVNGTSVASVSNSTSLTGQQIWIGENNTGSPDYFYNGYIDDLRITKGYARYTATFTPPTAAFPNIGPT